MRAVGARLPWHVLTSAVGARLPWHVLTSAGGTIYEGLTGEYAVGGVCCRGGIMYRGYHVEGVSCRGGIM